MTIKFRGIFCLLLISFCVQKPILAREQNASFHTDFKKTVKNAAKHKFFSVTFTQELYSILRNNINSSSGILTIQAPSSFRFEINSPRKELYVSNGKDFWKFVPDLNHAQHLAAKQMNMSFIKLLTDLSTIEKFYTLFPWTKEESLTLNQLKNIPDVQLDTPPKYNADVLLAKLVPKGDKQQKVLYAIIQTKTGIIQELRIVQLNGNRTRLVFSNYNSTSLSSSVFNFSPPQGIVVDSAK